MGSAMGATRIGLDTSGWTPRTRMDAAIVLPSAPAMAARARVRREQRLSSDVRHELPTPLNASASAVDLLDRQREDGSRRVRPVSHRVTAAAADSGRLYADSPVSGGAVTVPASRRCVRPGTGRGPSPAAGTAAAACPGRVECEERPAESGVSFSEFGLFNERGHLTRL